MTTQHTPGPWASRGRYVGTPNHMSFIAECRDENGNWTDTPHTIANARLIAAAPELLEALTEITDAYSFYFKEGNPWGDKARAAIAKATGADHGG